MSVAKQIRTFLLLGLFLATVAATSVAAAEETRSSQSVQSTRADRDAGLAGKLSKDEHAALITEGSRATEKRSLRSEKLAANSTNATANYDFWFYSADVLLFNDHDVDGHFHGVDLLFDADTYYDSAEVYAVVYLSLEGGPWNEYSATDNFLLFGASADDEFNIVTELVSGYPTGSYDLLIELFDGYNDEFLASFGPVDTSELAFLPLEDANRDVPFVPPSTTVIVEDNGGSMSWIMLLVLALGTLLLRKLRQERTQQAVVRVQTPPHLAKEVEPTGVGLDNRFRS